MKKIEVKNLNSEKVRDINLNDSIWTTEVHEDSLKKMIRLQLAATRQGTHKTKNRSEVSGGGRKPWKQKGTGRARQGSIRAPQWIKGGIALGPRPRSYTYRINKKERQLALKSVLSAKLAEKELVVVDKLDLKEIKTKEMAKVLTNIKANESALVVLDKGNKNVQMSARNIEGVKASIVDTMNTYDILKYNKLVLTEAAVKKIEEVYA